MGVEPQRIDILTTIDGVNFAEAYARKSQVELDGIRVAVLARADLIANKRACGRPKDLADLDALHELPP